LVAGADLHGAVTACGADEFLDAPTGLVLDPVVECEGGEHDVQVRFDRITLV
jgi:hypothetical protein